MRKEASTEQWKALYESATRLKVVEPWKDFWDLDLIGIQKGTEEETVFFSILGKGGECYGISAYEGYEGLNCFMMLMLQKRMNLSIDYVMSRQKNLVCYWGNREELSTKQRKIIKELGYKYRGRNQWLYFMSFEPGYQPYNLDQDEVIRLTEYFQHLELALRAYQRNKIPIDFEKGNMLLFVFEKDQWILREKRLPFESFQFGNLVITDEELLSDLKKVPGCNAVLEVDIMSLGSVMKDKRYDRPISSSMCVIGEAGTGMIIKYKMLYPEDDGIVITAKEVIDFIFEYGLPKEIRVSNILVEAGLEQLCEVCGIRLHRKKRLKGLVDFQRGWEEFL